MCYYAERLIFSKGSSRCFHNFNISRGIYMGKIINFPALENQEKVNSEEDEYKGYKEYYSKENEHNRKVFEAEQFIADQKLAIESFQEEENRLKEKYLKFEKMIDDMQKELEEKKQELEELKKDKNYIVC